MAYPNFVHRSVAAAIRRAAPAGIVALGLLSLAPATLAQSTGADPIQAPRVDTNEGFGSSDANSDGFGGTGSPFDLIHRAMSANDRSPGEFSRQYRGHISTEADSFRTLQQDALRRQQAQPEAPEVVAP
ncbi:MAG: hypothetical protein WBG38_05435 [Nodosilinea sp.]